LGHGDVESGAEGTEHSEFSRFDFVVVGHDQRRGVDGCFAEGKEGLAEALERLVEGFAVLGVVEFWIQDGAESVDGGGPFGEGVGRGFLAAELGHAGEEALDVAADLMLGLGHEDADRIDTLFQLIRKVHQSTVARLRLPFAVPRWVPIRSNRRERRFTRKLQDVMQAIIDERDRGDLAGDDFLSLMLRWRRDDPENVSPTWLREQAMGLLLAAYEPIANATTWALTELADHPECERRVVDECCSVLSGDGPTMETYPRLEYTRMVLDETFRIHSSPWLLTRVSISEDVLPSGQTIRAGDRLFVSPYTLHRREDLYADPERFDPERFTAERRRKRKAYAYIPFGGGPRICIGEHLGRMMGVIALAVIVPRWRMRPVGPRPELESLNGFTAQPIDGRLMMCVERRDDGAGDE